MIGSQSHRVALHRGPRLRLEPVVGHKIDRSAKNLLELTLQPGQPDQAHALLNVHQKVDVAVWSVLTSRRAAEQTEVAGAVLGRHLADPVPAPLDGLSA